MRKIKALFVDDDPYQSRLYIDELLDNNFDVQVAETVEQALEFSQISSLI